MDGGTDRQMKKSIERMQGQLHGVMGRWVIKGMGAGARLNGGMGIGMNAGMSRRLSGGSDKRIDG